MIFVFWRISPFITAPLAGILALVSGLIFWIDCPPHTGEHLYYFDDCISVIGRRNIG